jgi:PAS domain S-box-containing protein
MPSRPLSAGLQQLIALTGFLLALAALALGLKEDPSTGDVIRAIAQSLSIAVPIAVGLFALNRDRNDRFARLLVIAGFFWAPTMLAFTTASVPYSIGRIWAWAEEVSLIYLLLALPVGRLVRKTERVVALFALAVLMALFIVPALFEPFPNPSAWTGCVSGCPDNAFQLTSSEPGFFEMLGDVRGVFTVAAFAAAAVLIGSRIARDRRVIRVYVPALVLAVVHLLLAGFFFIVRDRAPESDLAQVAGIAALVSIPLLVLAFFVGLLHWRLVARNAWARLTPDLADGSGAEMIRALVADALGDPSVELGYWDDAEQRWIDEQGWPIALPPRGSPRAHTEIVAQGQPVAVFVHDNVHLADATISDLVRGVALLALENQRLEAGMHASMRALRESRARIMAAIDKDRLRIERDLHDGAQQRLIALKVAADLGIETLGRDPEKAAELFRRIGDDAGRALDEVRSLARGVYPPLLIDFGLVAALNDACSRVSVPAVVRARGVGRYPPEIEAAVYFCCLEALQNAEKHSGARAVTITLVADGNLTFEVRDDGHGFDVDREIAGAGLGNMRDRVAAVDGKLRVDSVPGTGTRVGGTVPLAPDHLPPEVERLVLNATEALHGALGIYKAVRTSSGTVVDFAVEHVNDAACALSGMSRQAQVGRTLSQLDSSYLRSTAFDWHREALDARETLVREECEYAWTAGGRRVRVAYEVRAVALGAGRIALLWHDITERKRAEQALRLRAASVEQEGDGVCVVRASTGAIAYANERFERMLGYEAGELEGRDSAELDWQDPSGNGIPRQAEEDSTRLLRGRRKDGTYLWCELSLNGFDDPDLGWCWVTVNRDVTARRSAQEMTRLGHESLGTALRALPLLAYTADRDLRCTLLFDNLVDPLAESTGPRTGRDVDLFGPLLADQIANANRRALVTATSVRADVSYGPSGRVTLTVEPVISEAGELVGLVGSALADDALPLRDLRQAAEAETQAGRGPRGFSRLR